MNKKGYTLVEVVFGVFYLLFLIGYIINIGRFAKCDFKAPYTAEVVYGLGIVTGYGGITGYIDIEDGES